MKYNFYYDESEHSRKINYNTITADNYYDSFITVIVGWCSEDESEIRTQYVSFEEKYADRKSHGELKSKTIKQSQLQYGFASMNEENVNLLDDFLSIFNKKILVCFSVTSKIEFVITQLFENYQNSMLVDMDALKYSIIKAILAYRPKEVFNCIYNNTDKLVNELQKFFRRKIKQNDVNILLKRRENEAFEQILSLLDDVQPLKTIEWNYDVAFVGFKRYLQNKSIDDYTLTIDKEGEHQNTINAAQSVGLLNVKEEDSVNSFGIRMADMFAGLISKLLKALYSSLEYHLLEEKVSKKILGMQWFMVNEQQLSLYKKMHRAISELNDKWNKSFSCIYSDDIILFTALLEYMSRFTNVKEIMESNINMQGEYFNSYICKCLDDYFSKMRNKLPVKFIHDISEGYYLNDRGAKVFLDTNCQPTLKFYDGKCRCNVLSVGLNNEGIPLVTVMEEEGVNCYRLPRVLSGWAMTLVGYANMGINLFPSEVLFSELNGQYYADIL